MDLRALVTDFNPLASCIDICTHTAFGPNRRCFCNIPPITVGTHEKFRSTRLKGSYTKRYCARRIQRILPKVEHIRVSCYRNLGCIVITSVVNETLEN